jgi:hypothetical protein
MKIAIIAYCLLAAAFLFGLTLREELRQEGRPHTPPPIAGSLRFAVHSLQPAVQGAREKVSYSDDVTRRGDDRSSPPLTGGLRSSSRMC